MLGCFNRDLTTTLIEECGCEECFRSHFLFMNIHIFLVIFRTMSGKLHQVMCFEHSEVRKTLDVDQYRFKIFCGLLGRDDIPFFGRSLMTRDKPELVDLFKRTFAEVS